MKKIECRRCGTCCVKGGPVLHNDDLPLITNKIILPNQLVVIREGEPAYNPGTDAVEPTVCEMLKIQGKPGSWECLFYDGGQKSCTIHANRPLECHLLQCRDTKALLAVTGKDCLSRQDIVAADDPLSPYLQSLAEECSWHKIHDLLATPDSDAVQEVEKILHTDLLIRQEAVNRFQISLPQELFYFGRPMFQSLHHPGLQLSFENNMPRLRLL